MSDAPLRGYNNRHEWFWEPGDESHIFPLEDLMDIYYRSVGHNSTLIMGLTPGPDGLLPEQDVARLREWGEEIKRRFSDPLASTSGEGNKLEIKLDKDQPIDHIVLQEDISKGERIRKFIVEALVNKKWETVFTGSAVGHKLIIPMETVITNRIRLVVEESIDTPVIKHFHVYSKR
jgi:alpha-L-fucosidase